MKGCWSGQGSKYWEPITMAKLFTCFKSPTKGDSGNRLYRLVVVLFWNYLLFSCYCFCLHPRIPYQTGEEVRRNTTKQLTHTHKSHIIYKTCIISLCCILPHLERRNGCFSVGLYVYQWVEISHSSNAPTSCILFLYRYVKPPSPLCNIELKLNTCSIPRGKLME